jgi:hypothetical protein
MDGRAAGLPKPARERVSEDQEEREVSMSSLSLFVITLSGFAFCIASIGPRLLEFTW